MQKSLAVNYWPEAFFKQKPSGDTSSIDHLPMKEFVSGLDLPQHHSFEMASNLFEMVFYLKLLLQFLQKSFQMAEAIGTTHCHLNWQKPFKTCTRTYLQKAEAI